MWSNGPYQQNWPLAAPGAQQQNVDWGALAQAWIQNRAVAEDHGQSPLPAKNMPVNNAVQPEMQVPSFPSTSWQNQGWGNAYTNNWMNNNSGEPQWFPPPSGDQKFTPVPPVVEEKPPLPPPPSTTVPEPPGPPDVNKQSVPVPNFPAGHDAVSQPPVQDPAQHGSWNEQWNPQPDQNPEQWNQQNHANFDGPQWGGGPVPPPWAQGMHNSQFMSGQAVCMPQDAMNAPPSMPPRKLLPAWIREGLEKIEQDKQKKINMEQNNQGQNAAEKLNDEHASNKKSRFDSASEGESDAELPQAPDSPNTEVEEDDEQGPSLTSEEKQEELLMKVRRWLTHILLEVTDAEIVDIASEVHKKASKAPAKPLIQSSALSSISKLGVVSGYSSDEEESSHDEKDEEDSSSMDEEELLRKRGAFEKMQVDRIAELENEPAVPDEQDNDEATRDSRSDSRAEELEARNQSDTDGPSLPEKAPPTDDEHPEKIREKEPPKTTASPRSSSEASSTSRADANGAVSESSRDKERSSQRAEVGQKDADRESPKRKKSSKSSKHERDSRDRRGSRDKDRSSRKKVSRSNAIDSDYDDRRSPRSSSRRERSTKKSSESSARRSSVKSSESSLRRRRSSPHRSVSKKESNSRGDKKQHHSNKSKKRRKRRSPSSSSSSSSSFDSDSSRSSSASDRGRHKRKHKSKKARKR